VVFTRYYEGYKVKEDEMGGHEEHMGEMRTAYKIMAGSPERKRLPGRSRHRWKHIIGMDLREIGWKGVG
jgi:hypothetical protein